MCYNTCVQLTGTQKGISMLNPRDRERTYRESDNHEAPSTGGAGILWLIAIVIAVIGLTVMAKHGADEIVAVPIGISLFFMLMFIFSHRRETRQLAWRREMARLQNAAHEQVNATAHGRAPNKPIVDTGMRKIFDRFDSKVIAHGRMYTWKPADIASFLDFARDFVDTQHANELVRANEKGELDRHLEAALDRALLQHDIAHPDKKPERRFDDSAPF